MASAGLLPAGFEDLAPYVEYWVRDTNDARWRQRSQASMGEIQGFYDAMLARAEDALSYLDQYPLDTQPPEATRLAHMLLALGQAAIAVEMHGQPRAPYSPFPHDIRMVKGPWPFG